MIGIDIGTKFVKLASLQKKGQEFYVRYAAMAVNPSSDSLLSGKIRSIAKDCFPFDKKAVTSIGGCQILARNFELAVLDEDEMEGAVMIEAKQSMSADLSSMYSDYQVLPTLEKDKRDALFIAAPSQLVDKQTNIIERSGLNIEAIDVDNLAVTNCYNVLDRNAPQQSVVLLNIGHTYTNISVIDMGALRFIRNVNFGGANISAEIANMYHLPVETAEEIKKHPELWKDLGLNIKDVLRKKIPDLVEAVYRSMEYCMGRKKIVSIDKILVTGGSSNLSGIDSFIADALGVTAERWNPLNYVRCGNDSKKEMGGALSIALGLAMREWKKF